LDNTHVEAHRTLAVLLVETGRQSFAFDLLNGWQARNPMAADPPIELARLYQETGDQQRAVNYLADALRLDSYNARALKAMGHIREQQGQWAMALENYTRAYQADSRQSDLVGKIQALQTRLASSAYPYQNPGQVNQF
jgi:Tfp pilus assembly protein PilF